MMSFFMKKLQSDKLPYFLWHAFLFRPSPKLFQDHRYPSSVQSIHLQVFSFLTQARYLILPRLLVVQLIL